MLDKLTHYKDLLNTEDKRSSDIMDLSSKISSKDSWSFDNLLTLKLHQSNYHSSSSSSSSSFLNNNNNNDNTNTNENNQLLLLSSSSAKSLAYCTPNPVPNLPENNQVHFLEYRGAHLATFTVNGRDLICLPQAFELFLKHLVGGLHTVYTKLKRLDIIPVVCNVEQVRILRGLGAIQPGVNRCKLIAPQEFDILYADCTNSSSRPGRPSKRLSGIETPGLSSVLGSHKSRTCHNNDSGESTPKQSRSCASDDDNSGNNQSQVEQTLWPNSQNNISTYPLMSSYELVLPQLLKSKVFGHLETVYSSFMKYAFSNHQNKLEHEQNSSGSTELKSVYDGVENIAFPSIDLPRIFSGNIMTHTDQFSTETFLGEEGVNSFKESKTIENSDQTSKYQQLFDFKLQYFLNQFIGMNYHWKSVHHSMDSSQPTLNVFDSQIKPKVNDHFDQSQHHPYSLLNMNTSEYLRCDKFSLPVQTLFSQDSVKETVRNARPSTSTNDYYSNDEEFFDESLCPNVFTSLGYSKKQNLNKPTILNFSVEQIKTDSESSTMHESNDNETNAEKKYTDTSEHRLTDFKRKETILGKCHDNCDDADDHDDNENADEEDVGDDNCDNNTSHNTDMSRTLTALNYYYWWLQYMSNELPRVKQSVVSEAKVSVFNNFPSHGCYANDDSLK
ncbi:unnamed protein product [Schistosoma rodhaini]|uniref:SKI/SNO/DAC domain-containing protein n=1 Tax=Schistosoma rodhaini TaxID=6188 RepID=A0AA85FB65_9TREM|nr:unnamed protein product [Schistosoma rodhaini]CAH8493225.1 unnamed protein product [Schistosoma rodhaini]